jgi:uncharacterized protein with HEPN domain
MREDPALLLDIVQSCERIQSFIAGKTREQFASDPLTQDAVLRRFGVIGEASRMLSDETKAKMPEIPWRQVIGMRNVLTHVYFALNLDRVWDTATKDIEPLRQAARRVLGPDANPPSQVDPPQ